MKRITFSLLFLVPLLGFAQNPLEKIKEYATANRAKFLLTQQDVTDLVIVNEFSSESTGINNYHVKQRYNGIEVFNSDSNFWMKNGAIINGGDAFIPNIAQKVNATAPSYNVQEALRLVLPALDGPSQLTIDVLESNGYDYKLTNGALTEYPIRAELVYFKEDGENGLKLAWDYEFYSQDFNHLWNLKVDAVNGKLLEKKDMVISCHFGSNHANHNHTRAINFSSKVFKNDASTVLLTPGTTQYRVVPWNYESPNHSARQLVTNPESTTPLAPLTAAASPNGWHNTNAAIGGGSGTTQYNYTRGNNVYAKDDTDSNNSAGVSPTGGTYPSLVFDFPYPGTIVDPGSYLPAATTNLFYMNNIMHDLWYQYGFNELNKNFQISNYGRGGTGNDAVIAEAQDGSTLTTPNMNNANFATPSDGSAPRMQMYLWDYGPQPTLTINAPASAAQTYTLRDNNFQQGHIELPDPPDGITANLVLFDDGTTDNTDACTASANPTLLSGKIAVIRRGTCTFVQKVLNAQQAGAVAAVIVDNQPNGTVIMGGSDATISIPALTMNMADGEALIAAMSSGGFNGTLANPNIVFLNTDGDFDNGIISHEYGHGISTRLSGNCLGGSEQMGEGWSDWFWLMMQIKPGDTRNDARGIGTFATYEPTDGMGIRRYKYSTNMAVNPHTYGSTNAMVTSANTVDSHSVGSVWCVILWDLAWNYIDRYGYSSNIYNGTGGNNKVMRLVLDAIKLDGCNPTFVTARDALIAADQATTGGQNYCMIWETFARRGVGVNASSGNSNSGTAGIQDQVEDFSVPPTCAMGVGEFTNQNLVRIYPNPTRGILNIAIHNYVGKLSVQVYDLNGRLVFDDETVNFSSEHTARLNGLENGVYLIKLKGENLEYTQKIIIAN
ncbi:T9SS-dependent M36 family metallopeptidase [Flavobacterium pedocola]